MSVGWRLVIDFLNLIGYVTLTKFKMETVSSVVGAIRKEDVMFSIGLKDASFQISTHPDSRSYLCIALEGKAHKFKALCFSLSTTPQVFTRVFSLLLKWAHRRRIWLLRYLDNWLVITELVPCLLECRELSMQLCRDLEIVVNLEKSNLKLTSKA